jgi:hypothetical protein
LKIWLFLEPRVGRNPVHFPSLAVVIGESLLVMSRLFRDIENDEPHQDATSVERFLTEELARPFLNSPTVGVLNVPLLMLEKLRLR